MTHVTEKLNLTTGHEITVDVVGEHVIMRVTKMPDKPEIPEGFERWEGGDCPVPEDCMVKYLMRDCNMLERRASVLSWEHVGEPSDIIAYRVTHVPTLTIDDEVDKCWFVFSSGKIDFTLTELKAHYPLVIAGMAYRTREHAETAMKWGLLHDVYYTKMGFERPVI